MSDAEHELIVDNLDLREQVDRLGSLALRSLAAASSAQDIAFGRHEAWIDDAKRETTRLTAGSR